MWENKSIYRSFSVASVNFPGQHHTWRLSPLLQNGSELTWDSLLYKQAWAAAMIHVVAAQRFTGDVFSIKQSFNSIHSGIRRFLGSPTHLISISLCN